MPYHDSQERDDRGRWTSGGSSSIGALPPASAFNASMRGGGSSAVAMAKMQDAPLYKASRVSDPYLGTRAQFMKQARAFVRFKKSQGIDINEKEYLAGQNTFYTFKSRQRRQG